MSSPFQKAFSAKSPLHSSSPDRPFTARDTKRKEDKLIKTGKQLEGNMSDRKRTRKENKLLKTADQLERNASGDKTPFYMEDTKLKAMNDKKIALEKKIADIKAKAKKENKIGNWDSASDELSRLNERIAEYKSKNPK
jgi:hypothetical protein